MRTRYNNHILVVSNEQIISRRTINCIINNLLIYNYTRTSCINSGERYQCMSVDYGRSAAWSVRDCNELKYAICETRYVRLVVTIMCVCLA